MNYAAEDSWIAEAEITLADLSPDKEPRRVEPSRRELLTGYALACSTAVTGSAFIPHDPAIGLKARGRILGIHVGEACRRTDLVNKHGQNCSGREASP